MKRINILAIITLMTSTIFAQDIKDVYNTGGLETVIVKNENASDDAILGKLNIDDFTMGENVRITKEMREEMEREELKRAAFEAAFAAQEEEKRNPRAVQNVIVEAEEVVNTNKVVDVVEVAPIQKKVAKKATKVNRTSSKTTAKRTAVKKSTSGKVYKHKNKKRFSLKESLQIRKNGKRKKGGKRAKCYKF